MVINPLIFILLVASVVGLSAVIFFLISSFNHVIRRMERVEEEKLHLHDGINQKAQTMLEEAHESNLRIIEEANQQAADILASAKLAKDGAEGTVREKLDQLILLQKKTMEQIGLEFSQNYKKTLEKMQMEDVASFAELSKTVEQTVSQDMQVFTKTLKEETVDAHKIMQERVEEEYAKVETDIETYKQEQFKKIDLAVYPLLKNVISLVIGRSLTVHDHEELIVDAIKQARLQMPEPLGSGGQASKEFPKTTS